MNNYTIRVVDAKTRELLYEESFKCEKQHKAMTKFMDYIEVDTENGSVYLKFLPVGIFATLNDDDSIEYYLVYC